MGFMIVWAVVSGILFVVGLIGFCINKFEYYDDDDTAVNFVFVAVAGLFWPILAPLALIGLVTYMILFTLVHLGMVKKPKWWDR